MDTGIQFFFLNSSFGDHPQTLRLSNSSLWRQHKFPSTQKSWSTVGLTARPAATWILPHTLHWPMEGPNCNERQKQSRELSGGKRKTSQSWQHAGPWSRQDLNRWAGAPMDKHSDVGREAAWEVRFRSLSRSSVHWETVLTLREGSDIGL